MNSGSFSYKRRSARIPAVPVSRTQYSLNDGRAIMEGQSRLQETVYHVDEFSVSCLLFLKFQNLRSLMPMS